jgi:alanine racemase
LGKAKGRVWLNGQFAPISGNICMDMFMIDVTGIDCREGDEVEIFGENISAYEVAKILNTIGYEVLTNISRRVKRVYIHS